jgi:hypothetical protein
MPGGSGEVALTARDQIVAGVNRQAPAADILRDDLLELVDDPTPLTPQTPRDRSGPFVEHSTVDQATFVA